MHHQFCCWEKSSELPAASTVLTLQNATHDSDKSRGRSFDRMPPNISQKIRNEISAITRIIRRPRKVVSIYIELCEDISGTLLVIPLTQPLSPELMNLAWKTPCTPLPYAAKFRYQDIFEQSICSNGSDALSNKYVAYFGVHYTRFKQTSVMPKITPVGLQFSNQTRYGNDSRFSSGYFVYDDFCMIIMYNRKVVDYAIHAYINDICVLAKKYDIKEVFYNGRHNPSLEHFLQYKWQPFASINAKFIPLYCNLNSSMVNFCNRNSDNCALCQNLNLIAWHNQNKTNVRYEAQRMICSSDATTVADHINYRNRLLSKERKSPRDRRRISGHLKRNNRK